MATPPSKDMGYVAEAHETVRGSGDAGCKAKRKAAPCRTGPMVVRVGAQVGEGRTLMTGVGVGTVA